MPDLVKKRNRERELTPSLRAVRPVEPQWTEVQDDGKWTLHMGFHRGTMLSRDLTNPTKHDSLETCIHVFRDRERMMNSIGYSVWFAKAIGPNEEETTLHVGVPYR